MTRRAITLLTSVLLVCGGAATSTAAPGDLDTSFGPGGRVVVSVENSREENPRAVVRDSMGRVLVVGTGWVDGVPNVVVQRILGNGAPDAGWEVFHRYPLTTGSSFDVSDAELDADGKLVIAGTTTPAGGSSRIFVMRISTNGFRDTTFGGGDGWVDAEFTPETEQTRAVALQPDGRILVAGYVTSGADRRMMVARFTAAGVVDTSFGGDGLVDIDPAGPGGNDQAWAVTSFGGTVIVAGRADVPGSWEMAVAQLSETDGTPLTAFDTDGIALVGFATAPDEQALDVVAYNPGVALAEARIVVAGEATSNFPGGAAPAVRQVALAKLSFISGALDASFDGDGKVLTRLDGGTGSHDLRQAGFAVRDVAPGSGDETLTVGAAWAPNGGGDGEPTLLRYSAATGALDASFAGDGSLTVDVIQLTVPRGVHVDAATGVATFLGETADGGGGDTVLVRATAGGDADATFSGDGFRVSDVGDLDGERFNAVAPHPDGGAMAAGVAIVDGRRRVMLARLSTGGGLAPAFFGDIVALPDLPFDAEEATDVAVTPTGEIVVVGTARAGGQTRRFLARFTATGTPDPTFDGDGSVLGTTGASFPKVAIDDAGRVLMADTGTASILVWRFTAAGAPDSAFGGGAGSVVLTDPTFEFIGALAVDAESVLVGATGNSLTAGEDRALVWRLTTAGALDAAFAPGGQLRVDVPGEDGEAPLAVRADGGRLTIAGTTNTTNVIPDGARVWTARFLPAGAPDPDYPPGGAGLLTPTPAYGLSGAFLPDGRAAAIAYRAGTHYTFLRGGVDGALDVAFGVSGFSGFATFSEVDSSGGLRMAAASQTDGRLVAAASLDDAATTERRGLLVRVEGDLADLSVSAPASAQAAPGQAISVAATMTSTGPQTALSTDLTITLPAGLQLVSLAAVGGDCTTAPTATCRFAEVAPGGPRVVQMGLRATTAGTFGVGVSATGPTADPTPNDRAATVTVNVTNPSAAGVTPPGPPPAVPVRDTSRPVVRLLAARATRTSLRSKGLRITVVTNEPVTGTLAALRGKRALKSVRVRALTAGRQVIRLRLSTAALRRLGKAQSIVMVLRVNDAAGNPATARLTVRLRPR